MKSIYEQPDLNGHFGQYGGCYIGETLMPAIINLGHAFERYRDDKDFNTQLEWYYKNYAGRPTPLYFAKNLSKKCNGAKIYLKREDLAHTGAHKINNTIGQALLATFMGKKRVIAETGAGQHGVATATVAALFGLKCSIFMGIKDIKRQSPNVKRIKLLGAEVIPVDSGSGTLKDAMNEALRHWAGRAEDTFYVIGSVAGPHPYPVMVREFQKIIGIEAKEQITETEGRLPDLLVACVGGGSNAMGLFYPFLKDKVVMKGAEAAGKGIHTNFHAATLGQGTAGVLHGSKSYLLQNKTGQVMEAHSISAGLDYPGVGPEHAYLKDTNRVSYLPVDDNQALKAFEALCTEEGIIPALESSHALYLGMEEARKMNKTQIVIINLSGRGDKDLEQIK